MNNSGDTALNLIKLLKDESKLNLYKNNMKTLKSELDSKAIIKELNLRKDYVDESNINDICNNTCRNSLIWGTAFRLL